VCLNYKRTTSLFVEFFALREGRILVGFHRISALFFLVVLFWRGRKQNGRACILRGCSGANSPDCLCKSVQSERGILVDRVRRCDCVFPSYTRRRGCVLPAKRVPPSIHPPCTMVLQRRGWSWNKAFGELAYEPYLLPNCSLPLPLVSLSAEFQPTHAVAVDRHHQPQT